jgi:hypothetical protein
MKRKLIATALGFVASLAVSSYSYGQGFVIFENTDFGALDAPVTFGVTANSGGINATSGARVGSEFVADLMYSLDGGTTYTLLTAGNANPQGGVYPTHFFATDGDTANGAGYFNGPQVTIPGYTSGAVKFIVEAYNGASYSDLNTTTWRGQSAAFTVASLATGQNPAGPFDGGSMQAFAVNPVPEPSILALSGLGAAALMLIRRKK